MKKMVIMAIGMLLGSSAMVIPCQQQSQQQNDIDELSQRYNRIIDGESRKFNFECMNNTSTENCNILKRQINKYQEKLNLLKEEQIVMCNSTTACQQKLTQIQQSENSVIEQQLTQMQQRTNGVIEQQIQLYNCLSTKYQGLIGLCNEHNITIPMDLR